MSEHQLLSTLSRALTKAEPMLKLNHSQLSIGETPRFLNTVFQLALIRGWSNDPDALTIGKALQKLNPSIIILEAEVDGIAVVTEMSTFPLRLIESLAKRQEAYNRHMKESTVPLHIRKEYSPPLVPLYLTSSEEKRKKDNYEQAFFLAITKSIIKRQYSRTEGNEIYVFYYKNRQANEVVIPLAASIEQSFKLHERELGEICESKILEFYRNSIGKALDLFEDRRELAEALAKTSSVVLAEKEGDKSDTFYSWFSGKIEDLFVSLRLPRISESLNRTAKL